MYRFTNCFGIIGLCDFLHGTDKLFRSNKAYERHKVLLGLNSARELVPDEADKSS
jgi:fatty acid hydroxylase domain-containing protein 2